MEIKLCGIRRPEDVEFINEFRPDYMGLVFAPSPRQVTPKMAATLRRDLSPGIRAVGVFVNEPAESVARIAAFVGLDAVQLHGDETAGYLQTVRRLTGLPVWKAVRVSSANSVRGAAKLPANLVLYDAFSRASYGGTGKTADWDLIAQNNAVPRFFLAGGLNESNLLNAVQRLRPTGVDLSGGIETGGVKDRHKIEAVMNLLRKGLLLP